MSQGSRGRARKVARYLHLPQDPRIRRKIMIPGTISASPHATLQSSQNNHRTLRVKQGM
ncbi:hypothetical protein E2C01_095696 [Portunus trituberculatus]|uniref:Uncharacterized protein n=1 Tax=Portunus trituberculatus TaxID=210409 RepID=A0A5B7K107_PORTR|nr:hypothetical protein [Portunus trituberculatus]